MKTSKKKEILSFIYKNYWHRVLLPRTARPVVDQTVHVSRFVNPNVAKAGGLQSQGVKGEVVAVYRDPFTTQDLKSSGFPEG